MEGSGSKAQVVLIDSSYLAFSFSNHQTTRQTREGAERGQSILIAKRTFE
jgi:hypothetical protein